jgi:hypothetical protein
MAFGRDQMERIGIQALGRAKPRRTRSRSKDD